MRPGPLQGAGAIPVTFEQWCLARIQSKKCADQEEGWRRLVIDANLDPGLDSPVSASLVTGGQRTREA